MRIDTRDKIERTSSGNYMIVVSCQAQTGFPLLVIYQLTMADVAGLVISVATAWKTCVQIFEIVDTSRKYGWDYEVLRIKLEVERVRLLAWGEAVGLAGLNNSQIIPDPRLRSREIQSMVMGVFGCIQNIFENSEALQNKYGLRPSESHKDKQVDLLRSVFKREYNTLLRSAKERQRDDLGSQDLVGSP
jgi:hypothetical protein